MRRERSGLLRVGGARSRKELVPGHDRGVEHGEQRQDRRIRTTQPQDDGSRVGDPHLADGAQQRVPDPVRRTAGAVDRPLDVIRGDRGAVRKPYSRSQRKRHCQAVRRDLPGRRQARLQAAPVIGRQQQGVVEVRQDPDVGVAVVEHRVEQQAVGIAAIAHDSATRDDRLRRTRRRGMDGVREECDDENGGAPEPQQRSSLLSRCPRRLEQYEPGIEEVNRFRTKPLLAASHTGTARIRADASLARDGRLRYDHIRSLATVLRW